MMKHQPSEETKVASVGECTGLVPALPEEDWEDENYAALYDIHRAKEEKRGC